MLTDSHCHLASHKFSAGEIPNLLQRARDAGVTRLVSLVTSLEDLQANLTIAENPMVHTCIGIHPCDVHHAPDDATARLAGFSGDPRVCGIGETGLDYFHPAPDGWSEEAFRERQRTFLRQHFELAASAKLNVVIHTRDREGCGSFEDALSIYREYHASVRAVFHCFIGPWENARRVLDLGGLVSFGGVATFKTAHDVRETVKRCPAGDFMLETDAPYLAPEPFRGKRNEPAFVRNTAERIAGLRGESLESLALHTTLAAVTFFRLRPEAV
ncbi:TatD family hydrolase [Luteolibacter yonseiensis]|uniref:TatD family hydrolase n=1 Tax=Luteolibacter yonseiensis TaxID=1144680 RepID=A0A934VBG3_9BACT|nr:TatD family hydrolase [Luteolibacter yonseiensis]MBK1815394.1 TatD family hydrolase [Luteolibacter yonseiensis]